MITVIAAIWSVALAESSQTETVLFRRDAAPAPIVARIQSRGASPYLVVGSGFDVTGKAFCNSTPSEVVAAVKRVFGSKAPPHALIDLDPMTVCSSSTSRATAVSSRSAGSRMASVVKALKAAFPQTKWAWQGLPASTAPSGTRWTDPQFSDLAASVDWVCPGSVGQVPNTVRGSAQWSAVLNAVAASKAWSPSKPVIVPVTNWQLTASAQASSAPRPKLMTNSLLVAGPVAAARASKADGIVLMNPSWLPSSTAFNAASSLDAAVAAVVASRRPAQRTPPATGSTGSSGSTQASPGSSASGNSPASGQSSQSGGTTGSRTSAELVSVNSAITDNARRALAAVASPVLAPRTSIPRWVATDWDQIYDQSMSSPRLMAMMVQLNAMAHQTAQANADRFIRPLSYEQIPTDMLHPGFQSIAPQTRKETWYLANVDTIQTSYIRTNGYVLAIVARRTRNQAYIDRCVQMLEAISTYVPLQRPGSTYWDPAVPMTPEGDGVWLATAWGIDAIVDMLSVLKEDVPEALRKRLEAQLRDEVLRISKDWADKRPWFVKGPRPQSNQWIEPNIGLVKACMFLGDDSLIDAYNLGTENLAATLSKLGSDGSYPEGVSYAEMTVGSLHQVLRQMSLGGETRFRTNGFVQSNWRWFAQMHLPGRMLVNSFDSGLNSLPTWAIDTPLTSFADAALATDDPAAIPSMRWLYPALKPNLSLSAIRLASAIEKSTAGVSLAVPTFEHFPAQQQLVWRSDFEPVNTQNPRSWALWIRGGSPTDLHCHRDQGHFSVQSGNVPVLIDCGTPSYGSSVITTHFQTPSGHNVMQVGARQPYTSAVSVPISVQELGAPGGRVSMNLAAAYPAVPQYQRTIEWDSLGVVDIVDDAQFGSPIAGGTELFRFHTGSTQPLEITGSGGVWRVTWQGHTLDISCERDILVTQSTQPDAVLPQKLHQAVQIAPAAPAADIRVRSVLTVARPRQP
jgi:hypothetical protein